MDWTEEYGCGIKMGWLGVARPPHHKFFKPECILHDEMYNLGGSEEDRMKADSRLFGSMVYHSITYFKNKAGSLWWFVTLAYAYYVLIRLFGKMHFNYRINI